MASDYDGTIAKVEFYQGANLLGTATTVPYAITLNGVAAGTYSYTAKAYDSLAASTVSTASSVTVNAANTPPTVSLTAPFNGATYIAPAAITLNATAADSNGITKVEFYQGATLLGTDTVSPYTWVLSNVAIGTYSHTAKAYDSLSASTVSTASTVTVTAANTPPTLSLTAPLNGATFSAPAAITLNATAADINGITKVEFYQGATLLGTDTAAPYTWTLSNVAAGSYSYSAKAYDSLAASTLSAAVNATVGAPVTAADVVWVDDATPPGATLAGTGEAWTWVSANPPPFSGSTAHQSAIAAATHQHYFYNSSLENRLAVGTGDQLFAYVYLDPANPPSEIMLEWNDGNWEHRAYWGANSIGWGVNGTDSRRYMGVLPPAGQWVRLQVPASQVGLEGRTLNGMAFTLYNGRATWDRAGKSGGAATNAPPTVSLTAPANGATFTAPAAITLSANAADTNGISKVEFYQGATLLGTDTVSPYTWALSNVAIGTYSYTAKAYDSLSASTVSTASSVTVNATNTPPTVSLTAPLNGATFTAPAAILLSATAADSNGITKVDFYQGAVLLGTDTAAPYSWALSNVVAGSYTYTAKATDSLSASTTSAAVSVTVSAAVRTDTITYYHNDALGSPIAATNAAGALLWRESYRPYGERLDNQPAGATNPIWYTGKRQDPETGLVYMGARYYNPALGRFLSIDPVEPEENNLHSLNRYAYANNNPTRFTDPDGRIPIDTVWDAGNVLYDLGKAAYGAATNNPALVSQGMADAAADGVAMLIPYAPAGSTKAARMAGEKAGDVSKAAPNSGRAGRQERLRELAGDSKVASSDRGWIKQEMNSIERSTRSSIRNPPGKDLAHERGREAAKGYGYKHSNLQDRDLHKTQHRYDNFGKANKERPTQ